MIMSIINTMSRRRRVWLVLIGLAVLITVGAAFWIRTTPRLNIILVTLDTTRADHLGAYGYKRGQTQSFDAFARRGVVFERAYAPAPVTLPSHATMLTGLYPPEHGLRVNGIGRLERHVPLLPEILKQNGYSTGAFIAAVVLDSQFGLDRGFDHYDDDLSKGRSSDHHFGERRREGAAVMDSALEWLEKQTSRPFFCWIHLYDAHAPYDPRPQIYGQAFAEQPYDAGVAQQVRQIERLTTFLRERKLDANTLVVVVGDHGEGLDDHGELEHGMLVYNTTLHVPFIFVGPSECVPATRVSETVSLVDLTPTLLDIVRIPLPKHASGRSLRPALHGESIAPRDCYAEAESPFLYNRWSPLQTVITDRWKYIQTTRPELYNLSNDPGEETNLIESAVDESRQMRHALEKLQNAFAPAAVQNVKLSEQDQAKLRSLGYVAGNNLAGKVGDKNFPRDLPDVKDMLVHLAQFERARNISLEGKLDEAVTMLQEIVAATSDFPAAELLLGDCLAQSGRLDEAVTAYRSSLAKRPDFVRAHLSLGKIFSNQARFEESAAEYRRFIEQDPDAAACRVEFADVLTKMRNFEEAIAEYREALRIDPDLVVAHISLGQLLSAQGNALEAADCFEQALAVDPRSAAAHANLMLVLAQQGQFAPAIAHGKASVALEPKSFDVRYNLGILLVAQRQFADGIAELQAARKLQPDDPRPSQQIQRAEAAARGNQ
jgi:arylsulfatase A-like enzyme/predicted Zn-dependent protease